MTPPIELTEPSEIGRLLRGETEVISAWNRTWSAGRLLRYLAVIVLGAGFYGAAMGWWRAPQQALFVAIKFPLILLAVTAGNGLLNGLLAPLLGLDIRLHQSFSAMVMSFTVTAAILGAFSPIVAFMVWNAPRMSRSVSGEMCYSIIVLVHVAVIALAGTAGNLRLLQLLLHFSPHRLAAVRVMGAWLTGNVFLGTQLAWILRPFIGDPALPVQFLRSDAFHGNFYETIFRSFHEIFFR